MASDAPPLGSITDVPGVRVGHAHRVGRGWRTGTTVVLVPEGATPGVDVRGGGPGTRETEALHPENLVQTIHAVCLTGGSAFGLAAADGVVEWLEERGLGVPVGAIPHATGVVPVVPAAVIFDLGRGGNFANRPDAAFGRRAILAARARQLAWGAVGAGVGAVAGGLQGGVGTASASVALPGDDGRRVIVGALAVVNASGSVLDTATGLPWERGDLALRRPNATDKAALQVLLAARQRPPIGPPPSLNTTIGVVATSAALTKSEVAKMSAVAHDGLARSIRPAHGMFDGDTVFGLATGTVDIGAIDGGVRPTPHRLSTLDTILTAAATTFAAACTHAVVAATTVGEQPAYLDLCPSARR